jgi:glycosyltransferase involved in cell wall biosynthesis
MISKACVVGAYQTKLEAIASHPDIELCVVVPPYWREEGRRLALERAFVNGYRLIVAPVAFNGAFHVHYYPTLPSILREQQPDICHIDEEPYNLATYLALRAARRLGAKTLFFTWQNLMRRYPPPFRWFESYIYRHADAAIAGNRDAASVLRSKGYQGRLEILPQFGVDPSLYCPSSQPSASRPFTIGYAGRLVREKGLYVLADALEKLGGAWRLILCGDGPLKEPLHEHFARLGLAERVRFCERVPSQEMPRYYAQMDVVVLPSLSCPNWKEQFGRVLVEAMACGVPVIGSDSGEILHVIGDAGIVAAENDALGLRAALDTLRQDAERRRQLGIKGRERVLAHYTQASIAAQTVSLYRELYHGTSAPIEDHTVEQVER